MTCTAAYSLLTKSADAVSSLEVISSGGTVVDGVCPGTIPSASLVHITALPI